MIRKLTVGVAALAVLIAVPSALFAAEPPESWDGLVKVDAKRLDHVYLLPGADFRVYTRILPDPTEVAFRKNWQRDVSRNSIRQRRISDKEALEIANETRSGFERIFARAFADAGYQLATAPGPDVLRVSSAVANLDIAAPDHPAAGRSRSFSVDAGEATMVLEVRDSMTGAVLGRVIDREVAGEQGPPRRTSVSNRADFEQLFKSWAGIAVKGLAMLKQLSPVDAAGLQRKP